MILRTQSRPPAVGTGLARWRCRVCLWGRWGLWVRGQILIAEPFGCEVFLVLCVGFRAEASGCGMCAEFCGLDRPGLMLWSFGPGLQTASSRGLLDAGITPPRVLGLGLGLDPHLFKPSTHSPWNYGLDHEPGSLFVLL